MPARLTFLLSGAALIALFSVLALDKSRSEAASTRAGSVLQMEVIARTPQRLARGKYLVEGLLSCQQCHSEMDFTHRPARAVPGTNFGGHVFPDVNNVLPTGAEIVAPNISPDPQFGAGSWQDGDFVRALRQGIGHDGRTLHPLMPYRWFRNLSDEDLASVIVYVRSVPPIHREQPKTSLPPEMLAVIQRLPALRSVPEPDRADRVAYGRYLVTVAHCEACHTPHDALRNPVHGLEFAGGQVITGFWGPDPKQLISVASQNLTSDPSGIPYYDENMFIEVIRTGKVQARPLSNVMPWAFLRNLTDADLKAIFSYLRTLPPVKHRVDNTEPPTYCRLCQRKHGFGDRN